MPDLLYVVLALGTFALFALAVEGASGSEDKGT
jgi:hypothetical protein